MTERARHTFRPESGLANSLLFAARQHGLGKFFVGRVTGEDPPGSMTISFVTIVPACLYTNPEKHGAPPILFDRTPAGEIILPGQWWQARLAGLRRLTEESLEMNGLSPEDLRAFAQEWATSELVVALVPVGANRFQSHPSFEELEARASAHEPVQPYNSSETGEIIAPDLEGRLVMQEVLLPGTEAYAPRPPGDRHGRTE